MNNLKDIERLIKDKLEQGGNLPTSQPQWHSIASKINYPPKKRKYIFWVPLSVAASIAIIFLTLFPFWTPEPILNVGVNQQNEPLAPLEKIEPPTVPDLMAPSNESNHHQPSSNITINRQHNNRIAHNYVPRVPQETIEASSALIPKNAEESTDPIKNPQEIENKISESLYSSQEIYTETTQELPLRFEPNIASKAFSLGVIGAVNYGNQNSGYVVALSARQDLGAGFFVDGSVSMVYNHTSNDVVGLPTSMKKADLLSSVPVQNAIEREAISYIPSVNTLYLQINPKIGYKIIDEVSISLGPDFQKLMNENQNTGFNYYTLSDQGTIAPLPSLDIGFTAQTEVDLSRDLKAGLLYRQGFNNAMNPGYHQFINRNYLQFQLKYSIGFKPRK